MDELEMKRIMDNWREEIPKIHADTPRLISIHVPDSKPKEEILAFLKEECERASLKISLVLDRVIEGMGKADMDGGLSVFAGDLEDDGDTYTWYISNTRPATFIYRLGGRFYSTYDLYSRW